MSCLYPTFAFECSAGKGDFDAMRYAIYQDEAFYNRCHRITTPIERVGSAKRSFRFLRGYTLDDYKKDLQQGNPLPMKFPCRKCLGCRLDHSREWADRLLMELCYHKSAYFVTLTYSDEHLPTGYVVDYLTGEIVSRASTLRKSDFQNFMKRLRFNTKQKLRYFMASEYGDHTSRPHYHAIIFGLELDDLELLRENFQGDKYYTSPTISKAWPFGYHILGKVTWESAAYVARYTLKKAGDTKPDFYYEYAGIEKEDQLMSNRPGIGYLFYLDHPDLFEYDSYSLPSGDHPRKVRIPNYFKKLKKEESLDSARMLYEKSQQSYYNSQQADKIKAFLTDRSFSALSVDQERQLEKRLSGLCRDTI